MVAVARKQGIKLLFMMDGDRRAIYDGANDDRRARPQALNRLVGELTARQGVPFIDLHPRFARDWRQRGVRFEYENDSHWNEAGHRLVADALVDFFAPKCGQMTARATRADQR
jgi:lysophospholipase L1-like esterase